MLKGFKEFLARGNVIDLAVAVVVGGAFGSIVNSLVKGIVTPLIGLAGKEPNFSNFTFTVRSSKFLIGDFINSILSFFIIAVIVYVLIVVPKNTIENRLKQSKKEEQETEKTCPECLSKIPLQAKRCKYCTTQLSQ